MSHALDQLSETSGSADLRPLLQQHETGLKPGVATADKRLYCANVAEGEVAGHTPKHDPAPALQMSPPRAGSHHFLLSGSGAQAIARRSHHFTPAGVADKHRGAGMATAVCNIVLSETGAEEALDSVCR